VVFPPPTPGAVVFPHRASARRRSVTTHPGVGVRATRPGVGVLPWERRKSRLQPFHLDHACRRRSAGSRLASLPHPTPGVVVFPPPTPGAVVFPRPASGHRRSVTTHPGVGVRATRPGVGVLPWERRKSRLQSFRLDHACRRRSAGSRLASLPHPTPGVVVFPPPTPGAVVFPRPASGHRRSVTTHPGVGVRATRPGVGVLPRERRKSRLQPFRLDHARRRRSAGSRLASLPPPTPGVVVFPPPTPGTVVFPHRASGVGVRSQRIRVSAFAPRVRVSVSCRGSDASRDCSLSASTSVSCRGSDASRDCSLSTSTTPVAAAAQDRDLRRSHIPPRAPWFSHLPPRGPWSSRTRPRGIGVRVQTLRLSPLRGGLPASGLIPPLAEGGRGRGRSRRRSRAPVGPSRG
jgi:hypothetical protein